MKVTVRYFASIREVMACGSETLETSATTLGELRDSLAARPNDGAAALARGRAVRMALNQVMGDDRTALQPDCEVAFSHR